MIDPAIARLLENYFDKVFVVSIERATDRHAQVRQQLKGLSFDFFFGTDKQKMDWEKIKANNTVYDEVRTKKNNRVGKGMNAGEVACALSHRQLYQHIVEQNYQRVLILEDDVVPLTENLAKVGLAINELPKDWDLVYFGYTKHEKVTPALKRKQFFYKLISPLRLIKWTPIMVKNMLPQHYTGHLKKAGYHDCTHAYAITRKTAALLIPKQTPVVFNADNLLSDVILKGEIKAFVTEPQFFIQENHLDPQHPSIIHQL
jgi:glycosyl transferase family 25